MIFLKDRSISRRTVLRGLAGTTLALPWLEIMMPKRASAAPTPKRMLTYFFGNGVIPSDYHCEGTETDFELSYLLSPLEAHKQEMIVTHGIGLSCKGFAHTDAMPHILTGTRHPGDHIDGSFRAAHTTIDQEIGKVIGVGTRYPTLEVGVHAGNDRLSTISWKNENEMNVPRLDPYSLAMEIFNIEPPALANIDPERRKLLDKSVLDAVYEGAKLFSGQLGREDQARLDAHMQSVHELENLLSTTDAPGGMAAPSLTNNPSWLSGQKINHDANDNVPLVMEMMIDLVTYALATDQTRVITFMASRAFGGYSPSWVDSGGDWHEFSHEAAAGNGGSTEKMVRIVYWLEQQLAKLIDKLKSVPEPGGTLLDNMVVCQMNEFGYDHRHRDLPYLFIGNCQGFFKTGRLVRFEEFSHGPEEENPPFPGTWNNNVLVTLAQAMGLSIDQFGDPAYPHGPIAELMA